VTLQEMVVRQGVSPITPEQSCLQEYSVHFFSDESIMVVVNDNGNSR